METRKIALAFAGLLCGTAISLLLVVLLERSREQTFHWKILATGRTEREVAFRVRASERPSQRFLALLRDPDCALHHIELREIDRRENAMGAELSVQCQARFNAPVGVKIRHFMTCRKKFPDLLLTTRAEGVRIHESSARSTGTALYCVIYPRLEPPVAYHADIAKARQDAFDLMAGIMDDVQPCLDRQLSQLGPTYTFGGTLQSDSGMAVIVDVSYP